MARLDAVIIGTGPAGLEAAVNLKIRKKNFLLFGTAHLSEKIRLAPKVDNYLGIASCSGKELAQRFLQHLEAMDIAITPQQVNSIYPMGNYFAVATAKETYEATTVVIAAGVAASKLLPGEERLLGRGVGYCATCDAPLYKGKTVAIVGYTDEAVHEANYTAEIAAKVYYIPAKKTKQLPGSAVEVVSDKVVEILGENKVSAIALKERTLEVDGVFVLRESIAPASLLPGIAVESGYIVVDSEMRTNLPGCFAAGDCTGKPHQYMRAAGQGQTAALSAAAYLDKLAAGK